MPPRRDVPREEPVELALMAHPIDRDIETMLHKTQPGYFNGEGDDIGKRLEEWLEKMDDYFKLAQSSDPSKAMMGRFKLEKSAKLWWQDHCKQNGVDNANVTWQYMKEQLQTNYQGRTFRLNG